ncbi:MAG: DUF2232 domain-containing protein [Peptostreptococcaceae bacterium]|nr:DUF2232 domain-containing protein [Peptostreptococcaceae bacterium]
MYLFTIMLLTFILPLIIVLAGIKKNNVPYAVILQSALVLGFLLVMLFGFAWATGEPLGALILKEIDLTVKTIVETPNLLKIAGLQGIGKVEAANLLTEAYAVAINMIPSTMICWGLIFSYFDYKLISNNMKKRGKEVLMLPDFSDFSLPRRAIYGCLLIYVLSWMVVGLKIVSEDAMLLNVQAIIEFVFAVQGFAVVIYTTKQKKMNKILRWAIYIMLFVSPFGRKFLALFGFFDLLVGIRQKLENK